MAHSGKTITFATDLLPNEDQVYNLGTNTQRWKINGDIQPIQTKTYENVIATANDQNGAGFFYAKVRGDTYDTVWHTQFRVTATVPGQASYQTISIFDLWGTANTYTSYACWNAIKSTSARPIYYNTYFRIASAGYTNGMSGWIGFSLLSAHNNTNSSYKRTVVVELLKYENCTVEMQDSLTTPTNIPSRTTSGYYNSTNTSYDNFNACDQGLQETGDANNGQYYVRYYTIKAEKAITSGNIIVGTSAGYKHLKDGTAFDITYPVTYAGSNISAGNTNDNTYIFHYSINATTTHNQTYTAYQPVFIKGTLSGTTFTPISTTPLVQTITEEDNGYVYYYIGRAYSATYMTFDATARAIYWYKNGAIREYSGASEYALVSSKETITSVTGSSGTKGYLTFSPATSGNNGLVTQSSLYVYDTMSNNVPTAVYLNVGTNQVRGGITLHSATNASAHGDLVPATLTANTTRTWTLPDATGTIALTSSNITGNAANVTGTVAVAHGGTGNTSQTANRLVWTDATPTITSGYHYASTTKVAINSTSEPTENFYVSGTIQFNIGTSDMSSNKKLKIVGNGRFLSFGGSGIMAYNTSNGTDSNGTLSLQYYGGNVNIGNASYTVTTTIYGSLTLPTNSTAFNFSGMGAASDAVARNVWFSYNGQRGTPVYDDDFKYNPSTNVLTVGKLTITGGTTNSTISSTGTMTISSGSTVYINSAANCSIIFQRAGNHIVWLDQGSNSLRPNANDGHSLGTSTVRWKEAYVTTYYGKTYNHLNGNAVNDGSWTTGATGVAPTATTTDGNTTYSGATIGTSILTLGNNKVGANSASGVKDNAQGILRLYATGSAYGQLEAYTTSANTHIYASTGLSLPQDKIGIMFRPQSSAYYTHFSYQTTGNEALVMATQNAVTSFIFVNGESYANVANNRWQSLTPALQIKNNSVYIGELITNGTTPSYKFKVKGDSYFDGEVTANEFFGNLNMHYVTPISTKTYDALLYNESSGENYYQTFATVTPTDYNAIWIVTYKITITASGHSDYTEICYVSISGRSNTYYSYHIYNSLVSYSIYNHAYLRSSAAATPHELGYRMASSYGATNVQKVVKVELLEQTNCTVTLLDSIKGYANATPSGYTGWTTFNATSNGLQETGDADSTGYYIYTNGFAMTAGASKVMRYTLFARLADGTYESFTTTSNNTGTSKTKNTHGFLPDGKIYYNGNGSDYSGLTVFTACEQYHTIDYRYTFNITTTSIPARAYTYIVFTYNASDGLLYLDDTWFTTTPNQTGKIYQRIGSNYYNSADYRGSLLLHNPYYYYDGTSLQVWHPYAAVAGSIAWSNITSKPTTISGYGITDAKIDSGVITLGSNTITPITSVNGHTGSSINVTASDLNLSTAMHFIGVATVAITDGSTTDPVISGYTFGTNGASATAGDVVIDKDSAYEYVWSTTNKWERLGGDSSYKTTQTAFTDSTGTSEDTTATRFVYSISQTANGNISFKTRPLPTYNNYSLPLAANGTRGGVQIGYTQSGKNYPVQLSSEKMYVNVPWTDTNTLVNYTLGTTTKAYLMACQDAPTSTTTARAAHGDTAVYLTSTTGQLSATSYNINYDGNEKVTLKWNNTDSSLDFIFI